MQIFIVFLITGFFLGAWGAERPQITICGWRQRSAAKQTVILPTCRFMRHNEAGSEPRTSWRGPLHRNQRDFWYFWSQKYVQRANTVRPYTAHSGVLNNLYPLDKTKSAISSGKVWRIFLFTILTVFSVFAFYCSYFGSTRLSLKSSISRVRLGL